MAIIPLYILNNQLEPYVAYDLIVDYPPIDIEPLPGVPKVGGVVRSYPYSIWYHMQLQTDVEREQAARPINIKKKSEFTSKIHRGQRITQGDHLSVKNSYFLAGNTDLYLIPDLGELVVVQSDLINSDKIYFYYNYTNSILYNNPNNPLILTSHFYVELTSRIESPNNTVSHYIRVSSGQVQYSYAWPPTTSIIDFKNFLLQLLKGHYFNIYVPNIATSIRVSITKVHYMSRYRYVSSLANSYENIQNLSLYVERQVLCETNDNRFLIRIRWNQNTIYFDIFKEIDLSDSYTNIIFEQSFDDMCSDLHNKLTECIDIRFDFHSSWSASSSLNVYASSTSPTILSWINNYNRAYFQVIVPSLSNPQNLHSYDYVELDNNNSGIWAHILADASSAQPYDSAMSTLNLYFRRFGTYFYYSYYIEAQGIFSPPSATHYLWTGWEWYWYQNIDDLNSDLINLNITIGSPSYGTGTSLYVLDTTTGWLVSSTTRINLLYYTSVVNDPSRSPDFYFYPTLPFETDKNTGSGITRRNTFANILDMILNDLSWWLVSCSYAFLHRIDSFTYIPPIFSINYTSDTFQSALERLDNVDLLIDNGFTFTASDYNEYAHRIATQALSSEGEKVPALACINTPVNTPPNFSHGLTANVALNTFLTTNYFKWSGLGFDVLLPASSLYAIRVTTQHNNLDEFAPIFNKPLISLVPIDKVYTDSERESLLRRRINSLRVYEGSWVFNNNITATSENIIFKEENIRRLANAIARECKLHLKTFIGQVNNKSTRERVINKLHEVFRKVILIHKYKPDDILVICDETNNRDYSNYLYVDIAIKMPLSIKYVHIVTVAQPI